jgi:hypothetical protein
MDELTRGFDWSERSGEPWQMLDVSELVCW